MGPTKNKIHCRWKKKRAEAKWQVDPITTGCGRDQNQTSEVSLKPRKQVVGITQFLDKGKPRKNGTS